MAVNDITIVDVGSGLMTQEWAVAAGVAILAGEPVQLNAESDNVVIELVTAEPVNTAGAICGIAASEDTATAAAAGVIQCYKPLPGMVYRCAAETAGNIGAGILYDTVAFDLTGTTWTINEDEGSDEDVHGLRILGFDANAGTVDFEFRAFVTHWGSVHTLTA
jgi:hypothetical protein|tara:strand:+ start:359 stop:847 length:489 start_codon:yes stop_codon:yes gene_type:complete